MRIQRFTRQSRRRGPIYVAAAAAALLAASAAYAAPPAAGPGAEPGTARASVVSTRPLPTLVPPPNDAFADSAVVPSLPFAAAVGTGEATAAVDDPFCSRDDAATVWYAWTAPGTAWVTAHTFGSDYDTILSAYTQESGGLSQVACNDDESGPQSQVTFLAETGVTYYLMAAGATGGGNLEVSLDVAPPLPQLVVRGTRHYELSPSADEGNLAWAQGARSGFRFWTLNARVPGFGTDKVNRRRSDGYSGGFEGDSFVYQEVRRGQSSLVLYDIFLGTRRNPPAGVNTPRWEWHPTISGDWLLFGRRNFATRTDLVILRNRVTGEERVLDRLRPAWPRRIAEPGQVSGNYAVWYRCAPACNVFLHDIAAETSQVIPKPQNRQQYDPSVTADGTVYFVRSRRGCGASVRLVRRPLGGQSTTIASLAAGRDSFHTYADDHGDGSASVYFSRIRCSNNTSDVLKVVDP
ncbi:MAG: hypothetical protein ACRDNI_10935 [Gaiellaceae bacterium]